MGIEIVRIDAPKQKQAIARCILEALPDWFGMVDARENYIRDSAEQAFFAAQENEGSLGFITLKETGGATMALAVTGVLKEYHRQGFARMLFAAAKDEARAWGCDFLRVKTVQMGLYPEYDATNRFYLSLGFREFEVFPTLWDECNPCQVYVMSLEK